MVIAYYNSFVGVLVIDEMKLTPDLKFDKHQLKVIGFTDLGEYTPANQINQEGDHALVFLFQPFRGDWIQATAAFLSKACVPGDILSKLIIEATVLLEKAGFFVEGVVTDGCSY